MAITTTDRNGHEIFQVSAVMENRTKNSILERLPKKSRPKINYLSPMVAFCYDELAK